MGKEIKIARQVLEVTNRRSLKGYRSKEFNRFVHVDKPGKPKKDKPPITPEVEKALHAYHRRKLAGKS